MLPLRKRRPRNRRRTDIAHLLAMAQMAKGPQAGDHRVEHRKKVAAKIILSEKSTSSVLLAGRAHFGLQQGQDALAELLQEIPVSQLVFPNRLTLLAHGASRPQGVNSYKLQSCYELTKIKYTVTSALSQSPSPLPHQACRSLLANRCISAVLAVRAQEQPPWHPIQN